MDDKSLRAYLFEMIGTFAFVFVSAGAVMAAQMGGLQPASLSIALATGLIYAAALAMTLPTSGGYLNPAVVLTLWVFRRMDGGRASGLAGMQILGGVIAGLAVRFLFPYREDVFNVTRLGATHVQLGIFGLSADSVPTLSVILKGIGIELALTFVVVLVLFVTAFDPRSPRWFGKWASKTPALWLGIALTAVTIVGFPLTGAAVNPARWLGPALAEFTVAPLNEQHPFADHAVYWIGPIAGALLAGWVYHSLVQSEDETTSVKTTAASMATPAVSSTLYRARK
jgi:aquaporin Z